MSSETDDDKAALEDLAAAAGKNVNRPNRRMSLWAIGPPPWDIPSSLTTALPSPACLPAWLPCNAACLLERTVNVDVYFVALLLGSPFVGAGRGEFVMAAFVELQGRERVLQGARSVGATVPTPAARATSINAFINSPISAL